MEKDKEEERTHEEEWDEWKKFSRRMEEMRPGRREMAG